MSDQDPEGQISFFEELARRRVFRVAAAYCAVAFVVWQAADIAFPALGLPDWTLTFVVVLAILGFPVALVLAWALQVTPEGIERTPPMGQPDQAASSSAAEKEGPAGPARARQILLGSGVVAVLAAAGVGGVLFLGGSSPSLDESRVVVFPFDNVSGDPELDALGEATAHWITDGLSRAERVTPVPATTVLQALTSGAQDGESADYRRLARRLGAGTMVTGAFVRRGDSVELRARISRVGDDRIIGSPDPVRAPAADPMAGVETLRRRILGGLAASVELPGVDQVYGRPPTYEAYRAYARGTALFHEQEFRAAIPHLREAFQRDTTFTVALVHLAIAHANAGETAAFDSILRRSEARREQLTRLTRLQVENFRASIEGNRMSALRAARAAAEIGTDIHDFQHGNEALKAGRPGEALEALEPLDPDGPILSEWSPYWTELAWAYHLVGRYEDELDAAQEGRRRFPDDLAQRFGEVRALAALGRTEDLNAVLDAIEVRNSGSGTTPGDVMRIAARALHRHGHPAIGRGVADRGAAWYRNRSPGSTGLLQSLILAERWEDADTLSRRLAEDEPDDVGARGRRGLIAAARGDFDDADSADRWLADLDRPYLNGEQSFWRASIAAHLDRKGDAVDLLRDALGRGLSHSPLHNAVPLRPLWEYGPFDEVTGPRG